MNKTKWILALIACVLIGLTVYAVTAAQVTVTFYSDNGTVIKVDKVRKHSAAEPPNDPHLTYGCIFKSWDKDLRSVTRSMDVHPVFEQVTDKTNVFAISGTYGKPGDSVFVPVALCGQVNTVGFDLTISYDADALELESIFDEDGDVVFNTETPGIIRCNFAGVKNLEADMDICKLKFTVLAKTGEVPVSIEITSIYRLKAPDDAESDEMIVPDYEKIDGTIYVLS